MARGTSEGSVAVLPFYPLLPSSCLEIEWGPLAHVHHAAAQCFTEHHLLHRASFVGEMVTTHLGQHDIYELFTVPSLLLSEL